MTERGRSAYRFGRVFIVIVSWLALALSASAQESGTTLLLRGDESPETVKRTLDALTYEGRAVVVRIEDRKSSAGQTKDRHAQLADLDAMFDAFVAGIRVGNESIARIPGLVGDAVQAWQSLKNPVSIPRALGSLVLTLIVATAAGWCAFKISRRLIAIPAVPDGARLRVRLKAASIRAGVDIAAIVAYFIVGRFVYRALLPELDIANIATRSVLATGAGIAIYFVVARFLLSPGVPSLRLLPLDRAERHAKLLFAYGSFGQIVLMSVALTGAVATDRLAIQGWFHVTGFAITILKLWWFWDGRHDFTKLVLRGAANPDSPTLMRRLAAAMTPSIMIVIAILIWVVGRIAAVAPEGQRWASAAGITQSTVILLPIVAGGVATLVREHFALHTLRDTRHPLTIALGTIATSFASGAIWIIGLGLLAQIWGVFLIGSESMLVGTGLRIVLTVTIVGIIAWTALTLLRAVFDAYTPKEVTGMPGEGDDAEPTVQSRLSTVLPLIRGIVLGFVIGITVLVGLSMLGVDISPLLAGAGILGLAISFGSQALVRDIVSGIFFMADDAFRAGEYVDTGRLKGTVEKITLRSIRLRHQSGQIHTIPFGQLQSITNFSRDWATMKFNIRLDPDADIERARKLAKKVGAAMQADPELGPEIILPLKMQGVSEIDIAAVVVRFKITCKPARSSWVQREALKRLFAAYNAEGIPFASNAVTVRGGDAAAGAAASASATSHAVPG